MFGLGFHFGVAHSGVGHVEGGGKTAFLSGNLLSNPSNPTLSPWAVNTLTVAAAGVNDPNGVAAYSFTNTGTGSDIIQGSISAAANAKLRVRCVAKVSNNNFLFLALSDESTSNFGAYFNISTGTVTANSQVSAGVVNSSICNSLGGGWYECIVIGHFTSAKTVDYDMRVVTASGSTATTSGKAAIVAEYGVYND